MLNWEYAPLNYEGELMPSETDILLLKAEEQIAILPPTPPPTIRVQSDRINLVLESEISETPFF